MRWSDFSRCFKAENIEYEERGQGCAGKPKDFIRLRRNLDGKWCRNALRYFSFWKKNDEFGDAEKGEGATAGSADIVGWSVIETEWIGLRTRPESNIQLVESKRWRRVGSVSRGPIGRWHWMSQHVRTSDEDSNIPQFTSHKLPVLQSFSLIESNVSVHARLAVGVSAQSRIARAWPRLVRVRLGLKLKLKLGLKGRIRSAIPTVIIWHFPEFWHRFQSAPFVASCTIIRSISARHKSSAMFAFLL